MDEAEERREQAGNRGVEREGAPQRDEGVVYLIPADIYQRMVALAEDLRAPDMVLDPTFAADTLAATKALLMEMKVRAREFGVIRGVQQ